MLIMVFHDASEDVWPSFRIVSSNNTIDLKIKSPIAKYVVGERERFKP